MVAACSLPPTIEDCLVRFGVVLAGVALLVEGGAARTADPPSPRPLRVCVLDEAKILRRSKLAINMAAHFQQVRQQAQAKFQDDSRRIDADVRALGTLRASLPSAAVKANAEGIVRRRLALKIGADQVNRNLVALDDELTAAVMKFADPIVRQTEIERGCSMLIANNVLLHLDDASLDITATVIERLNAGSPLTKSVGR
jgi:Skp family chaperone for outer membrane proteins